MDRDLAQASRLALLGRRANVVIRQATRLAEWRLRPARWQAPTASGDPTPHRVLARSWPLTRGGGDERLEAGKRLNVALAAPYVDGLVVSPERPFSFWRAVPRPTEARGFRLGMELRGGCIVPSVGGGMCLLSNALFSTAAELGWRVLERYGHTMTVDEEGSLDATVLWPHVDLRFAPRDGRARLRARVRDDHLMIEVWADRPARLSVDIAAVPEVGRVEATRRGPVVTTAMRRVVRDERGGLVEDRFVALDRKRLLRREEALRSCFTCQRACGARPRGIGAAARGVP